MSIHDTEASSYLDLKLLEQTFAGKQSVFQSLIEEYSSQVKALVPKMRQAFEDGAYESLEDSAHTLKGNSSLIGAHLVQSIARDMEAASRSKDAGTISARLEEIDTAVERTLFYLGRLANE
jgi:HPt (histidine-containing phosphotransfer) domain-containing protein